jgi:hypothetical protein
MMRYGEAFAKLGYVLETPRQDWSAALLDQICISIWRSEIDWKLPIMDSRLHGGPIAEWGRLPGNAKRIKHARTALEKHDGFVDAIIVDGIPGQGVTSATPWIPHNRKGLCWRITYLGEQDGHIRLEATTHCQARMKMSD